MIAGEKERGTLKAVLANRVPRDTVRLGKLLAGFTVLLQRVIPKAGEMVAKLISPVCSEEAVRVEKAAVIADLQDRPMDRGGEMFQRIFGTESLSPSPTWPSSAMTCAEQGPRLRIRHADPYFLDRLHPPGVSVAV